MGPSSLGSFICIRSPRRCRAPDISRFVDSAKWAEPFGGGEIREGVASGCRGDIFVMTPPGGVSGFHSRFVTFQAFAGRKTFPLQRAAFARPCAGQARLVDACSVGWEPRPREAG